MYNIVESLANDVKKADNLSVKPFDLILNHLTLNPFPKGKGL